MDRAVLVGGRGGGVGWGGLRTLCFNSAFHSGFKLILSPAVLGSCL